RLAYLAVLADIAGADGTLTPEESKRLARLCNALGVSDEARERVLVAARTIGRPMDELAQPFAGAALRFTLLADGALMASTDGVVQLEEKYELTELRDALDISDEQLMAVVAYLESAVAGRPDESALGRAGISVAHMPPVVH